MTSAEVVINCPEYIEHVTCLTRIFVGYVNNVASRRPTMLVHSLNSIMIQKNKGTRYTCQKHFSQKSEKHDKTLQYYPLACSTELETNHDPSESGVDEQKLRFVH